MAFDAPTYSVSTPALPLPPAPQVIYVQPQTQALTKPAYVLPYLPTYYVGYPLPLTLNLGLGCYGWRH